MNSTGKCITCFDLILEEESKQTLSWIHLLSQCYLNISICDLALAFLLSTLKYELLSSNFSGCSDG